MELKEFVSQSLIDIIEGVRTAQNHMDEQTYQAKINPIGLTTQDGKVLVVSAPGELPLAQLFEYDIAIELTKDKEGKTGLGVLSSIISAGAQVSIGEESVLANRIKFSVPVQFPIHY